MSPYQIETFELAVHPALAGLLMSAAPAWVWSSEEQTFIWANPAGLAFWNAANRAELAEAVAGADMPGLRRLKDLPRDLSEGAARIERLRLFAGRRDTNLACRVSWLQGSSGKLILVAALGPAVRGAGARSSKDAAEVLLELLEGAALIASREGEILATRRTESLLGEAVEAGGRLDELIAEDDWRQLSDEVVTSNAASLEADVCLPGSKLKVPMRVRAVDTGAERLLAFSFGEQLPLVDDEPEPAEQGDAGAAAHADPDAAEAGLDQWAEDGGAGTEGTAGDTSQNAPAEAQAGNEPADDASAEASDEEAAGGEASGEEASNGEASDGDASDGEAAGEDEDALGEKAPGDAAARDETPASATPSGLAGAAAALWSRFSPGRTGRESGEAGEEAPDRAILDTGAEGAQAPDAPATQAPDAETPDAQTPDADTPGAETPGAEPENAEPEDTLAEGTQTGDVRTGPDITEDDADEDDIAAPVARDGSIAALQSELAQKIGRRRKRDTAPDQPEPPGNDAQDQAAPRKEAPPRETVNLEDDGGAEDAVPNVVHLPRQRSEIRGEGPTDDAPGEADDVSPNVSQGREGLDTIEQDAFRALAEALGARLKAGSGPEPANLGSSDAETGADGEPAPTFVDRLRHLSPANGPSADELAEVLRRMSSATLIYRDDEPLFASRAFLELFGYANLEALGRKAGVETIFQRIEGLSGGGKEGRAEVVARTGEPASAEKRELEARLQSVPWMGRPAMMLTLRPRPEADTGAIDKPSGGDLASDHLEGDDLASDHLEGDDLASDHLEGDDLASDHLASVVDAAIDGILLFGPQASISYANRRAGALFGLDAGDLAGRELFDLFDPPSAAKLRDYVDAVRRTGLDNVLAEGRELVARADGGADVPVALKIVRLAGEQERYCAVLRDLTAWKHSEAELVEALEKAEAANRRKSDFLAKVSHEVRTPLNSIMGFAEVMLNGQFGPIANERYVEYVSDIHTSGSHLLQLVNDLLDLSKVEAGRLELNFTRIQLNELVADCVRLMQPSANKARIIIRSSLARQPLAVVGDDRSLRQICLNLISNAVKFTPAGGQVIVSTYLSDEGEALIRVRDTGLGMNSEQLRHAMLPFRRVAAPDAAAAGTGLGLPLTKALVEANRAKFAMTSAKGEGTLAEVVFPITRVLNG